MVKLPTAHAKIAEQVLWVCQHVALTCQQPGVILSAVAVRDHAGMHVCEGQSTPSCTSPCRYMCYLFFQLKTHADELADSENEEAPALSLFGALAMLATITIIVAFNSE